MRYSIVVASLAASAFATSYINVEVGNELSEASESVRRGNDNNNNNRRGQDGHCEDRNRENRNRDDRSRDPSRGGSRGGSRDGSRNGNRDGNRDGSRDGSRNGHRGGDRSREDRRRDGREDDREDGGWFSFLRTPHGRQDRYDERYGRCARKGQCDRNRHDGSGNGRGNGRDNGHRNYEVLSVMDIIFGSSDYECVTEARTEKEEEEAAKRCCHQIGGKLFDDRSRCDVRDVSENPEREWHECTRREKGIIRSDCFRHHREDEDNRRPSHGGRRQSIISLESEDQPQECKINDTIPPRQRYETIRCCLNEKVQGQLDLAAPQPMCLVIDDHTADQFRRCVTEGSSGDPEADKKVQCQRLDGGMN